MTTQKKAFLHVKFWAGLLLAQLVFFYIAAQVPTAVAVVESFFEKQKYVHQWLFGHFPFSAGDLLYILGILWLIYAVYRLFIHEGRLEFLRRNLIALNAVYLVYQLFWGMLYFQPPLTEKLPPEDVKLSEVKNLAQLYLKRANESRALVTQDKNGVYKVADLPLIVEEIQRQKKSLPQQFNLKKSTGIAPMKPSIFAAILSYTGILGYYNPFTAEGQYNPELPSSYLVFTLAHESAHQLGYAREQEASFIAFLCGENSHNKDLRHSTNWFVLKSLMRYLEAEDPNFNNELKRGFSPALQRDFLFEKNFFLRKKSVLIHVFQFTNDLFLKSNQQEGSVTYNYFAELFVRYERLKTKESYPGTRF